jgi:hypothetical protein
VIALHLFDANTGAHAAASAFALPRIFRRALRLVRLAFRPAPADMPAGAAAPRFDCCAHCLTGCPCDPQDAHPLPCSDGCNGGHGGLTDAEIAALHPKSRERARPTHYNRPDGAIVVGYQNHIIIEPSHPYACAPWPAAEKPTCAEPPHRERADDTRFDLRIARPYAPESVYGEVPVADVLEAEQAAS